MVQINVSNGQGITQAIKAKIEGEGQQITNNNLSVWQKVMTEVKTAQDNGSKIYTGGDDVEKINNRANWKTDFKVFAGQVFELAENVWNKIVELLTGKTPAVETPLQDAVVPATVPEQADDETPAEVTDEVVTSEEPAVDNDTVTVVGSSQTMTKTEADALVQKTLGKPLPEGVEVSFMMSNGTIVPTFKKDGQPISAGELKDPALVEAEEPVDPVVTGPPEGEKPEYDAVVRAGAEPVNASIQRPLTPEQLDEFLANDTIYQGYNNQLSNMDARMSEIEAKYDMPRIRDRFKDKPKFGSAEWNATFNISDKPEQDEYTKLGLNYSFLNSMLGKYKTVMQNWVDGPSGENSYFRRNATTYTNLERITLPDGRRAWKTDQGTFLPAPDGMPGGKRIEE